MTPPARDDAHLSLLLDITGRLGTLEGQNNLILQEQGRAIEDRRDIAATLRIVDSRLAALDAIAEDVRHMKPQVADYVKLRQNINGGVIVLGGIGAVVFTGLGFIIKDVWTWITAHVRFG